GRTGSAPVTTFTVSDWIGMYVPERKTSGNRTNWTTAGAASALRIKAATATPIAQKLAAPSSRVTTIGSHCDRSGTGTPYSRPTRTISPATTTLTSTQCASRPTKYIHVGSGVA